MDIFKTANLEELVSFTAGAGGKVAKPAPSVGRVRRSPEELEKTVADILMLLARNEAGMRAEQLRAELGLDKKSMPGPLKMALASGKIRSEGQKRLTTYHLVKAEPPAKKRSARK